MGDHHRPWEAGGTGGELEEGDVVGADGWGIRNRGSASAARSSSGVMTPIGARANPPAAA